MEILKFEEAPQRPTRLRTRAKKSSSKTMLGIAAAAVIAVVGSTLAANISLTSGASSEFGQGLVQATACDNSIVVKPAAQFTNASNAGSFGFSSVALSGIADLCAGKTFKLTAYGDTGSALNIATSGATAYTNATFVWATTAATAITNSSYVTTSGWSWTTDAGAITVGFNGTQATSGAVYKITLETN